MRVRQLVAAMLVTGFVVIVAHAAAANQCPASDLGACARLHLAMMQRRIAEPLMLVAEPMRAVPERG